MFDQASAPNVGYSRHETTLTNTVELAGENFEHDERETELAETRADVGAFERALRGSDLDQFLWSEDDGACAVQAQAIARRGMTCLLNVRECSNCAVL